MPLPLSDPSLPKLIAHALSPSRNGIFILFSPLVYIRDGRTVLRILDMLLWGWGLGHQPPSRK